MSDWRQHVYNVRHLKRLMRTVQNKKRSKTKSDEQQDKSKALIERAYQDYLDVAQKYLDKARATLATLVDNGLKNSLDVVSKLEIEGFMGHAVR